MILELEEIVTFWSVSEGHIQKFPSAMVKKWSQNKKHVPFWWVAEGHIQKYPLTMVKEIFQKYKK